MANILTCALHPRYVAKAPPTVECSACWSAYGHRRAYDDGLRSQGKAHGATGARSKAKGRYAVLQVVAMLLDYFRLPPDDMLVKATSQGGCDVHMSPLAARCFPFAIEVKNQEKLPVWQALKQAEGNAKAKALPLILFFTRAHTPLYVALRADAFLRLLPHGQEAPSSPDGR